MKQYPVTVVCVLLALPGIVCADVTVSEIAWMGSVENANAEWIELYNAGEAIEVTGWQLIASDGQPTIVLEGTLPGGAYALLERTSDDTVPTVTAHQVYTGAMGNTGEVFELKDAHGATIDRVDGGTDWALGGDNATKLTLQRNGAGWVTAVPTPGRVNAESDDQAYSEQKASDDAGGGSGAEDGAIKKSESTNTEKKTKAPPSSQPLNPALTIAIGNDRTSVAGVPVTFTADARKEGGVPLDLPAIVWNFGDGVIADGQKVSHTYLYPGEYVVQARGTRSVARTPLRAEDTLRIRIAPLALLVSHADADSIEIINDSEYDVDLSRFALVAGKQYFRIPQGTTLLKDARIRFSSKVTKLRVTDPHAVGIFTPGNVLASRYRVDEISPQGSAYDEVSVGTTTDEFFEPPPEDRAGFESEEMVEEYAVGSTSPNLATVAYADSGGTEGSTSVSLGWWLLALTALVGTVASVLVLARRERAEVIEGFVIESDE
jgi:hypothetical protein